MSFEYIKNRLTSLLYGLDGNYDIEEQFNNDPDNININIKQEDIEYILLYSFNDFIVNIKHKLENMYEDDEEDEEDDEEDYEEDDEDDEEETYIDNILWFIDIYIKLKDKLWLDYLNIYKEENQRLKQEIIKLQNKDRIKEEHISLQYYKENNRLIRQEREIESKMNMLNRKKKTPYPRKNCWKCRASCGGICVEHGG
jgi:hypothetical protein